MMTLETFFEKFALFADAPDAVAKMRELVLQLAVQGKLVDQKKDDGSAAHLLAAIELERSARKSTHRTPEAPSLCDGDDQPFEIPENWTWTKLGNIALQIQYGYTATADPLATAIRMLRITDIQNDRVNWPSVPGCQIHEDEAEKYLLSANDILIARTGGTIGKSFIVPDAPVKSVFASYLIRVTPPRSMDARYLKIFLGCPFYWMQLREMSAGTGQPNVNGQALGRLEIPLPPLAEQKRIVAKVDELMALCDRLALQQEERETRHAALARASLARFAEAPTPANLQWIFHQSYAIPPAALRKAILTLAVQGKLVPQDPNDEPAEEFLELIAQRLEKSKGKRSTNNGTAIADEAEPFDLPPGWAWSRFHDLGEFGRGKSKHRPRNDRSLFIGGNHRLVQTGDVARAKGTIKTHTGLYNDVGLEQSKMWPEGTLCITIAANIADSGILGFDACFPDSVVGFIPAPPIPSVRYFEYFIRTAKEHLEQFAPSTAQKNINLGILEQVWIPIPPLAEQRRIVAKVDELMALVDALETQLDTARTTATALLAAALAELTNQN